MNIDANTGQTEPWQSSTRSLADDHERTEKTVNTLLTMVNADWTNLFATSERSHARLRLRSVISCQLI